MQEKPYAEYWFGTHTKAPSRVIGMDGKEKVLSEWLRLRPKLLGGLTGVRADGNLPFLFKVLSVNQALSIQAHPNKSLAEKLHARDSAHYRDDNHKPEMAIAITNFEAMCGFRPTSEVRDFVKSVPEFRSLLKKETIDVLESKSTLDEVKLRTLFTDWMSASKADVQRAANNFVARTGDVAVSSLSAAERLALRLNKTYPGDVGVFAPFVLNYITMKPGDGIFLRANMPHSYLKGDIVECMACSDNVVRAGLTPKFRDVETLVKMLDYSSVRPQDLMMRPDQTQPGALLYSPDDSTVNEFEVLSVDVAPNQTFTLQPHSSPSIVLIYEGVGSSEDDEIVVQEGMVFLLPAGQSATFKATPHMHLRAFSARCREAYYLSRHGDDDGDAKVDETKHRGHVGKSIVLPPPHPVLLEEERAFRPMDSPLWCVASTVCTKGRLQGRPTIVIGGGGGSAKTGIKNKIIVGHVGQRKDKGVGLCGTFSFELDELPNAVQINDRADLIAFTVSKKCFLCDLEDGQSMRIICDVDISERSADCADTNPIAFSPSEAGDVFATGNGAGEVRVWAYDRKKRSVSLRANVKVCTNHSVCSISFDPSGAYIAVACGNGTLVCISTTTLKVLHDSPVSDFVKGSQCSTVTWVPRGSLDPLLVTTMSGPIKVTGIARKRKVTQHPSAVHVWVQRKSDKTFRRLSRCSIPLNVPVSSAALSSDSAHLALGHKNGSISVWTISSGGRARCLRTYPKVHMFPVNGVVFFGTDKTTNVVSAPIISVSGDGICRMQPVRPVHSRLSSWIMWISLLVLVLAMIAPIAFPDMVPPSLLEDVKSSLASWGFA